MFMYYMLLLSSCFIPLCSCSCPLCSHHMSVTLCVLHGLPGIVFVVCATCQSGWVYHDAGGAGVFYDDDDDLV